MEDIPASLPGATEINRNGLELARKLQAVVSEREKLKRRSTELEEELRLCRATLLELQRYQKKVVRTAIRLAVDKTREQLVKDDAQQDATNQNATEQDADVKGVSAAPADPVVTPINKSSSARESVSKLFCRLCFFLPIGTLLTFVLLVAAQAILWVGMDVTMMQDIPPLQLLLYPNRSCDDFQARQGLTGDLSCPDAGVWETEYVLLDTKSDKESALEWLATSKADLDSQAQHSELEGVFWAKEGHGLVQEVLTMMGLSVWPVNINQVSIPSFLGPWMLHKPSAREPKQALSNKGKLSTLSAYAYNIVSWKNRVVRCTLEKDDDGLLRRCYWFGELLHFEWASYKLIKVMAADGTPIQPALSRYLTHDSAAASGRNKAHDRTVGIFRRARVDPSETDRATQQKHPSKKNTRARFLFPPFM